MPDIDTRQSSRTVLPRLSITVQVYLFVLVLASALIATAFVAWMDAGGQAIQRSRGEIEEGLDIFQADFNRALRDMSALGNWLVSQQMLADLVQSRANAALIRYLEPWTEVHIADTIVVADERGAALAHVGLGQPIAPGESVLDLPGAADALSGKKSSGLAPDKSGRLQGRLVLPLHSADAKSTIGVIILGFYADGSFLQYRSRKPDEEIALAYEDRAEIITLTDQEGKPWTIRLPESVLKAQRERQPSDFVTLETSVGKYLFRFKPLQSPSSVREGMYGVGISLGAIDRERWNLFRTFSWGILVIAVGASVGGFLFARALTVPIRFLDNAAQAMARGDLSKSIHLQRDDELGDLARQMDAMRQQLRDAFQSATLEKSRYAAVIRYMGVAAVVTNQNLNIVSVNPAAEKLLKQGESNLLGQSWQKLFVEMGSHQTPHWVIGVSDDEREPGLTARTRLSLRERPQVTLEVISTAVELEGASAGYVHILRDATAEEQLVRAQDEFIMNAAHELRGPLASLRASMELLVEDHAIMPKHEMAVMLRTLQRAVVKFQGLVENIVDIGNIQAGRFRVRPLPVRLDNLIADSLAQVGPLLQGRAQRAQTTLNCASPCMVLADRPRIVQVLINLVTNASKYGPEGEAIDVRAFGQDRFVIVEVTDRGPGIAPDEQTHLFQRFYRGRRAEEEGIGIGLGLAMAKEIIEAHGGQIGVKSQIGEGTTFWFSLPKADRSES
jgi:PAS domain S-box-containing protein